MKFGDMLTFRKDLFFEGAVQADWFYQQNKAALVAENFVFHGSQYYGAGDESGQKFTDTITFTRNMAEKCSDDFTGHSPTLAIAGYGTGKSHLAVTLATLLSGAEYQPQVYSKILTNIRAIDADAARSIEENTKRPNLVLVLNGMRDFNLHYELLKTAQKSLTLYGCDDQNLKKLNRALETAFRFFERNAEGMLASFEAAAPQFGYNEKGNNLIAHIRQGLGEDERAFDIINAVYEDVNGNAIRWDEGVSASAVLETLYSEYCGISGPFSKIIIIFDEFGRYLEYASATTTAHSGDSALQQIFECVQNFEGNLQLINFIQADIKAYLQRVDSSSNISRYIGRYEGSDKYRLSSNLETIFANLIQRTNTDHFNNTVVAWQNKKENQWKEAYDALNSWLPATGLWHDYKVFRKVVVEGIYPLHPFSTYMLSKLSDYLQSRSSLVLLSGYIEKLKDVELMPDGTMPMVLPEMLLQGDLFKEMLAAEEEGRQVSQHCIRYNNVLRKYDDKLSENSKKILRANLALRILRCRTVNREDVIHGLEMFTGLNRESIDAELIWLENEYAVLGFDEHAACFDFLEESNGAHDFKTYFRRERAKITFHPSVLDIDEIRGLAGITEPQKTNFSITHRISTNEWQFDQELFSITELSAAYINQCATNWKNAISADKPKGKLIWLYKDNETSEESVDIAENYAKLVENIPVILMLLRDTEGLLKSALCDYLTLEKVPVDIQKKYGRHYQDKLQETLTNIQQSFDKLKKDRLCIYASGVTPMSSRLPNALTEVFDRIYPAAVPFDFDGFASKQPAKAKKAFCSITKLLLSGAISESTIHSFQMDVRNRFDATLFANSGASWKIINNDYQVIPPQNKLALAAYNAVDSMIPEGSEVKLSSVIKMLVEPPYGMSDFEAVYLISAYFANLSYCIRLLYKETLYNVNNWKDCVISDGKIELAEMQKTVVRRINAGAVNDQFNALFARINGNTDISIVDDLEKELDKLTKAENVPDPLIAMYQLSKMRLQEGKSIRVSWNRAIENVMAKYDDMLKDKDLYSGLQGMKEITGPQFYQCFMEKNYFMAEDQKNELVEVRNRFKKYIDPKLSDWIDDLKCKGVENINSFRSFMKKLSQLLTDLGYLKEAANVDAKAEKELSNVELIRQRQELKANYSYFMQNCIATNNSAYTSLQEWEKQGNDILKQIDQFKDFLGKEANPMSTNVHKAMETITAQRKKISDDMNAVYNKLCGLKTVDDIKQMIIDIKRLSTKGISEKDMSDFIEMETDLSKFLSDVDVMMEERNNRTRFEANYQDLLTQYEDDSFDFDVPEILGNVAENVQNELDQKDQIWFDKHLSDKPEGVEAIHSWLQDTESLPTYLKEETIKAYYQMKEELQSFLSTERVKNVVHTFKLLSVEEKKECFNQIEELLSEA